MIQKKNLRKPTIRKYKSEDDLSLLRTNSENHTPVREKFLNFRMAITLSDDLSMEVHYVVRTKKLYLPKSLGPSEILDKNWSNPRRTSTTSGIP